MFKSAAVVAFEEIKHRESRPESMRFGVDFLDDALRGILQDDLVLIGAPSGAGKTQLCCNIALANLKSGKRIHYIALEAAKFEIEQRMKFPLVMERFISDHGRPNLGRKLTYADWILGKHIDKMREYELAAAKFFETAYRDLFLFYKQERFGPRELVDAILYCSQETDLIIVDHIHYFDFEDDNENRAIRDIAKTVRSLAIEEQKPIVLIAHLRKRDRANDEICAGLDEFHGTSDLYKIASKVITMAPGSSTEDGMSETFFRIPKNRMDGGVTRFLGREFFNPRKNEYEKSEYKIGWADSKRSAGFAEIDRSKYPEWSRLRGIDVPDVSSRDRMEQTYFNSKNTLPGMPSNC